MNRRTESVIARLFTPPAGLPVSGLLEPEDWEVSEPGLTRDAPVLCTLTSVEGTLLRVDGTHCYVWDERAHTLTPVARWGGSSRSTTTAKSEVPLTVLELSPLEAWESLAKWSNPLDDNLKVWRAAAQSSLAARAAEQFDQPTRTLLERIASGTQVRRRALKDNRQLYDILASHGGPAFVACFPRASAAIQFLSQWQANQSQGGKNAVSQIASWVAFNGLQDQRLLEVVQVHSVRTMAFGGHDA